MAPLLAENKHDFSPTQVSRSQNVVAQAPPEKNIALALNYELPLVDQFLAETRRRYRRSGVEDSTGSTFQSPTAADATDHVSTTTLPAKRAQPASVSEDTHGSVDTTSSETQLEGDKPPPVLMTPPLSVGRRMSTRDKAKRNTNVARSRVRYDLQLVPRVGRNQAFLDQFDPWWKGADGESQQKPPSRRSLRVTENGRQCPSGPHPEQPFLEDHSTIWIPGDRREWEDTVSELTALCTQAGIRRHAGNGAPFARPLSQEYIRDRIDIDDPLMGFQLRHREGGWLQGFIMYTNFTTWNHGFRWDSLNPASGVSATRSLHKDKDGSIAIELESEPRTGDLSAGGIVFPSIAEIGLLGGLGCGEYLLRMALDNIRERKVYKFVVLQATDQSKAFYERFGFVRVGAVCQYGKGAVLLDLAGYRHWTHANESEISLEKHGGPSYMMCLKIPLNDNAPVDPEAAVQSQPSFLERMLALRVDQKPAIMGLGTAATPAPKVFKRIAAIENAPSAESVVPAPVAPSATPVKKKPGPKPGRKRGRPPKARTDTPATMPRTPKQASVPKPSKRRAEVARSPARKRRKTVSNVLSPYVEKQYNDIWLAVPATKPPSLANLPVKRKRGRPRKHFPPGHPQHQPPQPRRQKKTTIQHTAISQNGHRFHAVRGPDGKFIRVAMDGSSPPVAPRVRKSRDSLAVRPKGTRIQPSRTCPPTTTKARRRKSTGSSSSRESDEPNAPVIFITSIVPGKPKPIDKMSLRKQKVKSYPRDREHFFNRVVRLKAGPYKGKVFFVLECEEVSGRVCLVPMVSHGSLSGKREGRPRYQCALGDTDADFVLTETSNCELIRSAMVMKTSLVAVEAWDLETPDDVGFETR